MSFCENCGREILEESLGCPFCSVRDNIDYSRSGQERREGNAPAANVPDAVPQAEPVTDFTVEDRSGTYQRFETNWERAYAQAEPAEEKRLPLLLKIVVFAAVFMVGLFGQVVGAIAGVVLMKKESEEYRRFGKALLIFCIVLLAIEVVGAILFTMVSTNMMTYFLMH